MPGASRISRRKFLKRFMIGASGAGACAAVGGWIGAHRVEVTRTRIPIAGLPAPLEGFTIAQLSDFHHSLVVSAEYLANCVELANREKPDLIALTGDFITGPPNQEENSYAWLGMSVPQIDHYLEKCVEVLSGLHAPHGVFAVMGNHDGWFDIDKVAGAIGQTDWRLLRDEHQVVDIGGAGLQVVGLRDLMCESIDLDRAFRGVDASHPTVVLMHNPDLFAEVAVRRPDLILAGHTHGGQVSLPFIGPPIVPSRFGARYASGLFRLGSARMYVNRGLGTILPPIRFRASPEISIFTLTRAA
jgi:uncharacterized protein